MGFGKALGKALNPIAGAKRAIAATKAVTPGLGGSVNPVKAAGNAARAAVGKPAMGGGTRIGPVGAAGVPAGPKPAASGGALGAAMAKARRR